MKHGIKYLTSCAAPIGAPSKIRISVFVHDVIGDLAIPRNLFAEALDGFADVKGELIIEMFARNSKRYIRLGETSKYKCSD